MVYFVNGVSLDTLTLVSLVFKTSCNEQHTTYMHVHDTDDSGIYGIYSAKLINELYRCLVTSLVLGLRVSNVSPGQHIHPPVIAL